ncbi:hypothetical protein T09_4211 [Trichinella sp. T9]|nr:hypothetical protein T09_4211 [Trichinella sp. T9]
MVNVKSKLFALYYTRVSKKSNNEKTLNTFNN